MAIEIPDSYVGASLGDLVAGQPVKAATFETIAEDQHRLYAVKGFRVPGFLAGGDLGLSWRPSVAAPLWTQLDNVSATLAPGGWAPCLRAFRDLETDAVAIRVAAYLVRAKCRVSIYAPDTGTSLGSVTLANATGTWSWSRGYITLTLAEARAGGLIGGDPRPLQLYAEGAVDLSGGGTDGYISQIAAREYVLTSTDTTLIPRG